jgi:hypothetical protein
MAQAAKHPVSTHFLAFTILAAIIAALLVGAG